MTKSRAYAEAMAVLLKGHYRVEEQADGRFVLVKVTK